MSKKVKYLILTLLICMTVTILPTKTEAKTLGQLKEELAQAQKEYNENKNKQESLQNNIDYSNKEIVNSQKEIDQAQKDITAAGQKIQDLNSEIEEKQAQIKELMKAVQLTDGNIDYLEYIFGSESMTDLIHRSSIAEEISEYNDNLIDEMNDKVEESKKLQDELEQKQINLEKKIDEFQDKISSYNATLSSISDIQVDKSSEINTLKDTVAYYSKICKSDSQDITSCLSNQLPYDTAFYRPTTSGYVSSEYGYRNIDLYGYTKMHYATDIGGGNSFHYIYASSSGKVVGIENSNSNSCGGNYVIIQHNISGKYYTTAYAHMKSVSVSLGQTVTKDTILGVMGGNPYSEPGYTPWDKCSTGSHVHFMMSYGLNTTYTQVQNNSFNPRTLVNFPAVGSYKYFYDRTTKY